MAALPAARLTDAHVCPLLLPKPHVGGPVQPACAAKVLIHGKPAARATDQALCAGVRVKVPILPGAPRVLIMGLPAARQGDPTAHGGKIVSGDGAVLIG